MRGPVYINKDSEKVGICRGGSLSIGLKQLVFLSVVLWFIDSSFTSNQLLTIIS